jgi:YD repeat-containing protein
MGTFFVPSAVLRAVRRIVSPALLALASMIVSTQPAWAQAQLAVNGASSQAATVAVVGSTATVSITNGPGNATDWIGLYAVNTSDFRYLDWRYMNNTQTAPATGQTSGTVSFALPSTAGDYEFRLFANDTYQRIAVSGTVTAVPLPTVTSVTPSSANVGEIITIAGTNLRATQSASTVSFNGTTATPVFWSADSIRVPVPSGATTGPLVVTVLGVANSSSFSVTTVAPGTVGGTVTRVTGGSVISGATVEVRQSGTLKSSVTTAANGTYSIANLDPATYEIRVLAAGFSSEVRSATVSANTTSTVNVALSQPGSISGTITQANGTTPIAGAAVTLYLGPVVKASTNTNGAGAYSLTSVAPGSYTVQAASVGSRTTQQGATIVEGANTTANLSLDPAATGSVSYVYDELDRLVAVIDPAGEVATYTYDAVGNLLSIARSGVGPVSISEIAPQAGSVGSPITIYGTGFSTTASSNTVTFNGIAATVTASSATTLATIVPSGATTGSIAVTTPSGSATSTAVFVVTTGPPTITTFSPQIRDATSALTISGTNFDTTPANDRVNLNVHFATPTTASSTSLSLAVPSTATSGRVTVTTVTGTATSTADFFVPPHGYVAANAQSTGRITLGGSQTISIPSAGLFALRVFDGVPGHRVSASFTGVTIASGIAAIYDPYGRTIGSTGLEWYAAQYIDAVPMATAATYTLLVAATGASTGDATLNLYDVVDVSGTIVVGGAAQTTTITTPGQNAAITFSGTAGQRVSLDLTNETIGWLGTCTGVTIKNPDGTPLVSNPCVNTQGAFIDVQTLPATGTYTIAIDPPGSATGSVTLTLYSVPADVSSTIVAGGSAQTVTMGTPGQNASLTFTGTIGQRVSLDLTNETIGWLGTCTGVTIKNPDGAPLVSNPCVNTQGAFIDVQTLPATGTYTITIDPPGNATGSITLTLYDVPADVSSTIVVGGLAQAVTTGTPGQNASLTFTGAIGQRISLDLTNETIGWLGTCTTVTIKKPDGTSLVSNPCVNTQGAFIDVQTLPVTGTYTITIDPPGNAIGSMTLTLYDVPADASGTMVVSGAAQTVAMGTPGQNAGLTFSGTVSQAVSLAITNETIGWLGTCTSVIVKNPDGTTLASNACVNTQGAVIDLQTLPATGTYTVLIDPPGNATGSATVAVTSP